MSRLQRKWLSALLFLGVLVLALAPVTVLARHAGPEIWPAYYEGREIRVMIGPSGNSSNPNQAPSPTYGNPPSPCFGPGPNLTDFKRVAGLPIYYNLYVPGAHQMMCPDGKSAHNMIFTTAPGDPGHRALHQMIRCFPTDSYSTADPRIDSAAKVEAAITAGKLLCSPGPVGLVLVLGP